MEHLVTIAQSPNGYYCVQSDLHREDIAKGPISAQMLRGLIGRSDVPDKLAPRCPVPIAIGWGFLHRYSQDAGSIVVSTGTLYIPDSVLENS